MSAKRIILVTGFSTAIISPYAPEISNNYIPERVGEYAYRDLSYDTENAASSSVLRNILDHEYIEAPVSMLDLAKDMLESSQEFTQEEARGYKEFINSFFS